MAQSIEVGQLLVDRTTKKVWLVQDIKDNSARIVGISRLEIDDPERGRWKPFVADKEAPHGWIPLTQLLIESF